ncbi:uncharacterized protein K02A2.6-like [Gigantopelta aegis]|uniref:uncharacterized protein K02A2.6-like n=1 Tax=Gigantopelta aegis TaxID=1735272 RepID=UPI001B88D6C0|nr:uncharacterized protein K02A2.6-like [Gigantopelta aegis]
MAKLKASLTSDQLMAYFDTNASTELVVDASPVGLAAILYQITGDKRRIISYASRVLTPHQPGKDNPADYMSQHPANMSTLAAEATSVTESYVSFITSHAVPKAMTLTEIKQQTVLDNDLQQVIGAVVNNNWHAIANTTAYRSYWHIREELTAISDGDILLRGNRLIIPKNLQQRAIDIAHQGHQGIVKTKQLLREKVWFPGIDNLVEEKLSKCLPCQAAIPSDKQEPYQMSELPDCPWQNISVDFCGPFPSEEYLLVLIDEYYRYPLVYVVTSTSAKATISKLEHAMSLFGIPDVIKTDTGPPFNSRDIC